MSADFRIERYARHRPFEGRGRGSEGSPVQADGDGVIPDVGKPARAGRADRLVLNVRRDTVGVVIDPLGKK